MSERVRAAVDGVADRVAAAAGRVPSDGPERFRMEGVTPNEVSRRILSGLVELEDVDPLMDHLEVRVRQLMGSEFVGGGCRSGGEWAARASSIFMSELQCVAVGIALARGGRGSGATPLERAGARPPALESFMAGGEVRHGGFPGFVV